MTFIVARLDSQSVPQHEEVPVASGEAFEAGSPGALVDGEFVQTVDESDVITHISTTPFGTNTSGFGVIAGKREFPPGYALVTPTAGRRFRAEYTGSLPADPGGIYAVVKGADSRWRVDFGNTTDDAVKYIGPVNEFPAQTPRYVEVEFITGAVGTNLA